MGAAILITRRTLTPVAYHVGPGRAFTVSAIFALREMTINILSAEKALLFYLG